MTRREITPPHKPKPDVLQALILKLRESPKTSKFIPPRDDAQRGSPFDDVKYEVKSKRK
jgi:hypothetical protein